MSPLIRELRLATRAGFFRPWLAEGPIRQTNPCRVQSGMECRQKNETCVLAGRLPYSYLQSTSAGEMKARTATFLFTDIVGSTRLARSLGDQWTSVLDEHHRILREVWSNQSGHEFGLEGDSFSVTFDRPADALKAAASAVGAMEQASRALGVDLKVRIGVHSGEVFVGGDGRFSGITLHQVARIMSAAHGGQILVSDIFRQLARPLPDSDFSFKDLGRHRLKDFDDPTHLYQVCHPSLPDDFPPPRTIPSALHNLPAEASNFIGRHDEGETVLRLVEGSRLVTLTGAGGLGKTRLALQVARKMLESFPNGVWFVDLSAITDPHFVPRSVMSALDVTAESDRDEQELLAGALEFRELLLVLDNCEHLVEACAELAGILMSRCPGVRVLATSREALGIAGERLWPVPPLSLPAEDVGAIEDPDSYDALRLFAERAELSRSGFKMNGNAEAIVRICRRLDGMPLAIELAAAKVRVLGLDQIEKRLEDRFVLLAGSGRGAAPRQQTLRAVIDWSYELLDVKEKQFYESVSVFPGAFTLEAAEKICGEREIDEVEILGLLDELVVKSLVQPQEQERGLGFRMLDTIRAHSRERLKGSGRLQMMLTRHRDHYLGLVEEAAKTIDREGEVEWMPRLKAEMENIRAALGFSLGQGDGSQALKMAVSLVHYSWVTGTLVEGRDWIDKAIDLDPQRQDPLIARALWASGFLASRHFDYAVAAPRADEAMRLAEEGRDRWVKARTFLLYGEMAGGPGDFERAREMFNKARELATEIDDDFLVALCTHGLGNLALGERDFAAARSYYEEALALSERIGIRFGRARILGTLGMVCEGERDWEGAWRFQTEAVAAAREVGDRMRQMWSLASLSNLAEKAGDEPQSNALWREAVKVCHSMNDPVGFYSLGDQGVGANKIRPEVRELLERALAMYRKIGRNYTIAGTLRALCALSYRTSDFNALNGYLNDLMPIIRQVGNVILLQAALHARGMLLLHQRDYNGARAALDEALKLTPSGRAMGPLMINHLRGLSRIEAMAGDLPKALALLSRAVVAIEEIGALDLLYPVLDALADLALRVNHPQIAASLLGNADSALEAFREVRPPVRDSEYARMAGELTESLGEAEYDRLISDGRAIPVEEALSVARAAVLTLREAMV